MNRHIMYLDFTTVCYSCFRVIRKSQTQSQTNDDTFDNFGASEDACDDSDNDERPGSLDDKVRKKEMRKGMDLATTLERIEKNFVITDPRLPDNPIVRFPLRTI